MGETVCGGLSRRFIAIAIFVCMTFFPITDVHPFFGGRSRSNQVGNLVKFVATTLAAGVAITFGSLIAFALWEHIFDEIPEIADRSDRKVTFDDVVGLEGVLVEVQEFIDFLQSPERYEKLGAEKPRGLLLHGPPGCGKTLIARAIAGEADCHFISASGAGFVEVYVGVGPARVRALFDSARKKAVEKPVVIFVDEIDSVGSRVKSSDGGSSEYNNTINELLNQMDGLTGIENILVVGATNSIDSLDPALLRPGRFDRKVNVTPPNRESREAILRYYLEKISICPSVELDSLAESLSRRTTGFSSAEIKNLVNEAAILAGRDECEAVEEKHFEAALDKLVLGLESNFDQTEEQLRRVAYHEAGHALLAALYDLPLEKVSILSRVGSLGVTMIANKYEASGLYTQSDLRHKIMCFYGGFTAEELIFGEVALGVYDDLKRAGAIAAEMVNKLGMGGPQVQAIPVSALSSSGKKDFDKEVVALLQELFEETKVVLLSHRDELIAIAERLLERETIGKEEVYAIINGDYGDYGEEEVFSEGEIE